MVRKRNDGGAYAQDHRGVDLKVSVLVVLRLSVAVDVLNKHSNHSRLFFLNIQELNQSMLEELLEVPFSGHDFADVLLPELDLVVFYDEHGSLDATAVCVDLDLFLVDVPHDGVLLGKPVGSPHLSDLVEQLSRIVVVANPLTVQEDFVGPRVLVV